MSVLGTTINGYKILDFIDSGNFGSVYRAVKDDSIYAIKIFREDYVLKEFRDYGDNNRIKREIAIMKSVNHPCLIRYVDDFKEELMGIPSYFLVMEFAPGITLRKYIDRGGLTEVDSKNIMIKILEGLSALHNIRGAEDDRGIIHRDLKPENIIVDAQKNIKILDYGISKIIDFTSITTTGNVMGSPVYMSPEQITDSKNIDKRSDLYTVGVIFYEMLTNKLPYEFSSLPELFDKIKSGNPIPPRRWQPLLNNGFENFILKLLEKQPYKRFPNVVQSIEAISANYSGIPPIQYDLTPKFYLRLWNEKTILEEFIKRHKEPIYVEFPANHQTGQSGLLKLIQSNQFHSFIDPATMRLAYPAQDDNKGLHALPYAPPKFEVVTPDYLKSIAKQKEYVKKVIDEQYKLGAEILISPYHYIHNTNVPATRRRNPVDEWFDLDIKLLKESIDYKSSVTQYSQKRLYAGICLNGDSLLDNSHKTDLLNLFSAIECDGYFIYVDCIDNKTNSTVLYQYIKTLIELQTNTGKPVIAGRLNSFGLGLLCAGISGFSSGAGRFDSFYEGLYKEESEAYNLYERYYVPELLGTISVDRKSPIKLEPIRDAIGACNCYYCRDKDYVQVSQSNIAKLHFIETIYKEIGIIRNVPHNERLQYFIDRIIIAIENYKKIPSLFKTADFQHLLNWKEVFEELNSKLQP
jgi:serine/threonine protein kinase